MSQTKPVLVGLGDIVQLDPLKTENPAFAGCMMIVSALRPWGVLGYVQALGETREAPGGQAYYRARWGTFEETGGRAVWVASDSLPDDAETAGNPAGS